MTAPAGNALEGGRSIPKTHRLIGAARGKGPGTRRDRKGRNVSRVFARLMHEAWWIRLNVPDEQMPKPTGGGQVFAVRQKRGGLKRYFRRKQTGVYLWKVPTLEKHQINNVFFDFRKPTKHLHIHESAGGRHAPQGEWELAGGHRQTLNR